MGRFGLRLDREIELGREAHGAQHAHRIFAVARLGIADQLRSRARTSLTPPTKSQIEKSSML
jgi:hypothetical protein